MTTPVLTIVVIFKKAQNALLIQGHDSLFETLCFDVKKMQSQNILRTYHI